jgi:hypothetical protein
MDDERTLEAQFVHARTFETRWGLGLAFIDLDDPGDVEKLVLQLWQPIGADGELARLCVKIGVNDQASDKAHDLMSAANRSALMSMTPGRFEDAITAAGPGIAELLDQLHGTVRAVPA